MGARPLKRAIQSVIEDAMAEELLKGEIRRNSAVTVGLKDNKVVFSSTVHKAETQTPEKKKTAAKKKTSVKSTRKKAEMLK